MRHQRECVFSVSAAFCYPRRDPRTGQKTPDEGLTVIDAAFSLMREGLTLIDEGLRCIDEVSTRMHEGFFLIHAGSTLIDEVLTPIDEGQRYTDEG